MKCIPGYEGLYSITTEGIIVNSLGETIKKWVNNGNYHQVRLYKNGKPSKKLVHRMVAITYIPNPDNKPQINHKNGIRDDNRLENLEWCTPLENTRHAIEVLGRIVGKKNIAVGCYSKDLCTVKIFRSVKSASECYRLPCSNIVAAAKGRLKTCGGFIWKYV